jgi:uncharacterized phage protein gp47/JayE
MSDTSITTPINDTSLAVIDYTSRDFNAIIRDVSRRMAQKIPGWEAVPESFEMIMLDQFAYVGDILNFYIDRLSAEAYIQTAVLRESVLNLAYAFGYVPTAQTASTATVTFTKNDGALATDVVIPKGTQVYANSGGTQVIFETTADLTIPGATAAGSVLVKEGVTEVEEPLGVSSGVERMQFPLLNKNVIKDSVVFYVRDGGIDVTTGKPTLVPWTQIYRMIDADAVDRVFTIYVDEAGNSIIRTGDGVTGRIPTTGSALYATYRYGKGAAGNVGASTIKSMVSGGDIAGKIDSINNAVAAIGGADAESLQSMRTNIPRSLRALDRAVTLQDYADIAIQVPGVAKAAAGAVFNTNVSVAVLGYNYYAPDTAMVTALNAFFAPRKMIGTTVTVVGPVYKNFNVTGTIVVNQLYLRASVKALVEKALAAYYSFASVDFGFTSRLSQLFNTITSVAGVVDCTISAHYMQGDSVLLNQNITIAYNEFPKVGTITITATGGIVPT